MLHEFLDAHRAELIARCKAKAARRHTPEVTPPELEHGIPRFMDQLIHALRLEQAAGTRALHCPGNDRPGTDTTEIGVTAMQHGLELSKSGATIDQTVHAYGDLCQAVTEMACETRTPIDVGEFKTLNRCLDDAIAGAVTEFSYQQDTRLADQGARAVDERVRVLLQELQAHVQTATLAFGAVETGSVGLKGATGAIVGLSLVSMRSLIVRALADTNDVVKSFARH